MKTLFNANWYFSEQPVSQTQMYTNGTKNLLEPEDFFNLSKTINYSPVTLPHDWQIYHVKDLYRNSIGFYRKNFPITKQQIENKNLSLNFEGIYMNSAVFVNDRLAGKWKNGYTGFEFNITKFLKEGNNEVIVIAVYQSPNTRWYSGAGIYRDVWLYETGITFLTRDGVYACTKPQDDYLTGKWAVTIDAEISGSNDNHYVINIIKDLSGNTIYKSSQKNPVNGFISHEEFTINNPKLWSPSNPDYYILTTFLYDKKNKITDTIEQNIGFKKCDFTAGNGFFLNGNYMKLQGACIHHDLGALGSAFNINALKRQFIKMKEMGINAIRCSHNPVPKAFLDLADKMGFLVISELTDMWQKNKTEFDYANWFDKWIEKDTESWVKKDRNHPSLLMWSIGNEIYDTHNRNGIDITTKLITLVRKYDYLTKTPVTIASNYMWSENAQKCAELTDIAGYNYLERLYDEHHKKYPSWKIFGSETASTIQSRGVYHLPVDLNLVTFPDNQCSSLGNCSTVWGAENTQKVITNERDNPFSQGQFIWTAWDYIGEPTPYHTKNSYFGQIDTAGFEKDSFFLYKSQWNKNAQPFVHLLPYWDFNEGQMIDVKAYTNQRWIELFFNGKTLGKQYINPSDDKNPFGQWKLPYSEGELQAVAYDNDGRITAEDVKHSISDSTRLILTPEMNDTDNLFFIDIHTADKNNIEVENANNYVTVEVCGDAKLVGLDNGDSTDYDEYKSDTRRLFRNHLIAIVETSSKDSNFTVSATSSCLCADAVRHENNRWIKTAPENQRLPKHEIPVRNIKLSVEGSTILNRKNPELIVNTKILPENASNQDINFSAVLKESVPCDYFTIEKIKTQDNVQTIRLKANCDGECLLRVTASNGSDFEEIISDLQINVEEMGNPKFNPYELIHACRFTNWDKTKDMPVISLESGITNKNCPETWISFEQVDFGDQGADTIHIPIFSFDESLPVEICTINNESLGSFVYRHKPVYNTYNENIFTLNRRLSGIHTLYFKFKTELNFKGFYFDKTPKVLAKLRACDASLITGDSFTKTCNAVEKIGNNVTLDFDNMNFENNPCSRITICGRSLKQNNTINIKFFNNDGSSETQSVEFNESSDYEEQTFDLNEFKCNQKVSFIFLPGSNFDFKWFKFL